ncbi:MAG: 16S rRNA (guanine(527)-N(7))-methyltransferase RsmG [Treponema sp.]|jgi:16S rRNA (guanine527-N7)-methyltransferase|nr:16S rRNA (guanine(527)-N(7))-methyltransferase RsmG [Treponema sp.]
MDDTLAAGLEQLRKDRRVEALFSPRIDEIAALLEQYMAEIELFNPAYGLVSVKNRRELVVRHILDSLAALGVLLDRAPGRSIADVGSGAGLPGIPLAISLPQAHFTLIERTGRRAGFLRNTAALLGLPNVTVEETEMEKAGPGRFDLLVFRAFRPLEPPVLKGLLRLLAKGGVLAAWKGRDAAVREELGKLEAAGLLSSGAPSAASPPAAGKPRWEILPVKTPFLEEERRLVLIFLPESGINA